MTLDSEGHTEDLNEEVDGFQVCELVVVRINAYAEEQSRVAAVHDLVVPELHIPHAFHPSARDPHIPALIYRRTARTSTKFDWYFWSRGATSRCTSPLNRTYIPHPGMSDIPPRAREPSERWRTFSSSSYGTYHLERRVLPWRFCGTRAPSGCCCRAIRSPSGTDLDEDEADHGWRMHRSGNSEKGYIGDRICETETEVKCVVG